MIDSQSFQHSNNFQKLNGLFITLLLSRPVRSRFKELKDNALDRLHKSKIQFLMTNLNTMTRCFTNIPSFRLSKTESTISKYTHRI